MHFLHQCAYLIAITRIVGMNNVHAKRLRVILYTTQIVINRGNPVKFGELAVNSRLLCRSQSLEHNLKTIVEARAEVGHNFLAGVGYDKETIISSSKKLVYALNNEYVQPRNFYGVGGMKIFRDLIWIMRGLMKADHKYYKKHGVYDFPQKQRGKMMLMCLLGSLVRNKKIKAKMGNKFNEGMIAPYKKVISKIKEEKKD